MFVTFHHFFWCKYGIILPFAMEALNYYLVEELKATQLKLEKANATNSKLVEESLWLEARLDREVDRTQDLTRWFSFFVNQNTALSTEITNLREYCARLERRIILRDASLPPIDDNSDTTTLGTPSSDSEESVDLWE